MHYAYAYRFFGCLMAGLSGATLFTSCTTNSLTALSNQNIQAVSKIAQEAPAAETLTVGADPAAAPAAIVGTPNAPTTPVVSTTPSTATTPVVDQVAQEKPAQPAAAPVVLATVPAPPWRTAPPIRS